MKVVEGNLFEIAKEGFVMHQVNCHGVMGAGFARELKTRFPEIEQLYIEHCNAVNNPMDLVGQMLITPVGDSKLFFVHSFSQLNYDRGRQQTFTTVLQDNIQRLDLLAKQNGLPVYVPYKIGCGLAGGDWGKIEEVLQGTDITVVKLPGA